MKVGASGTHGSGPMGTPVVRDRAQTPTVRSIPAAPASRSRRSGRTATATAQANCRKEMTTKKTP